MRSFALVLLLAATACVSQASKPATKPVAKAAAAKPTAFSGKTAFTYTRVITEFGPRPSGSAELERTRQFIEASLASWKLKAEADRFTASTPIGKIPMVNYIVKIPGNSERVVIVSGHYDTKRFAEFKFLGANDGGSSTGVLLELARVLATGPKKEVGVWIIFHDGEEAQEGPWTDSDSLHGSKHLAAKLQAAGALKNVKALINIDMVGNKNLSMLRDTYSAPWLNDLVREAAAKQGLSRAFNRDTTDIQDDHLPYIAAGVPCVDLIDFTSMETFWHKAGDTMDKLSADSMEAVGRIVLAAIDLLAERR